MIKIDTNTWKRKDIFNLYSQVFNPFYMVTFSVDVTNLYDYVKRNGLSFYLTMINLVTKAINKVENFRYVLRDGEVYLLDRRDPSYTDIKKDSDTFYIVTLPFIEDIKEFNKEAAERSKRQNTFMDTDLEGDSLIYLTCTPNLHMTALTNERDLMNPKEKDSNIPYIAWGKFIENFNKRKVLNLSIEVNHRFVDGYHLGKFNEYLVELIEKL